MWHLRTSVDNPFGNQDILGAANPTFMARDLSDQDTAILQKLAPECLTDQCSESGHRFRSIIPPVANHFATTPQDFVRRFLRLDDAEFSYLVGLIMDGSESLGCLSPDYADAFNVAVAGRMGQDTAKRVMRIYALSEGCD